MFFRLQIVGQSKTWSLVGAQGFKLSTLTIKETKPWVNKATVFRYRNVITQLKTTNPVFELLSGQSIFSL